MTFRFTSYDQSNLEVQLFKNIHFPLLQRYQIPHLTINFTKRVKIVRNACDILQIDESLPILPTAENAFFIEFCKHSTLPYIYYRIRCFILHVEFYAYILRFILGHLIHF
jgi:hypothetical protein